MPTSLGSIARHTAVAALALAFIGARRAPLTVFDLDRVGQPVPAISVTSAAGTPLALNALRGKPTLIVLFASWCAPCMLELPWIRGAAQEYGKEVQFVGIDVLESRTTALAFLHHEALPFSVGYVDTATMDAVVSAVTRQDGGMKYRIPAVYAVAADGTIVGAWHGVPVQNDGSPIDAIPSYLARLGVASTSGSTPPAAPAPPAPQPDRLTTD